MAISTWNAVTDRQDGRVAGTVPTAYGSQRIYMTPIGNLSLNTTLFFLYILDWVQGSYALIAS